MAKTGAAIKTRMKDLFEAPPAMIETCDCVAAELEETGLATLTKVEAEVAVVALETGATETGVAAGPFPVAAVTEAEVELVEEVATGPFPLGAAATVPVVLAVPVVPAVPVDPTTAAVAGPVEELIVTVRITVEPLTIEVTTELTGVPATEPEIPAAVEEVATLE